MKDAHPLLARRLRCWSEAIGICAATVVVFFSVPIRPDEWQAANTLGWFALMFVALGAVTAVVAWQVRRSLADDRLVGEQIALLLSVVNLVVVFFALLYYAMADQFDGLGSRLDSLYFTVVTLCTVGFGDIVPLTQTARAAVTVQMLFDLVIVTSAISIIVTARSRRRG